MPKVDVSFKKTTRDMQLYMSVVAQEEKSEFVKRAIDFYVKSLEKDRKKA